FLSSCPPPPRPPPFPYPPLFRSDRTAVGLLRLGEAELAGAVTAATAAPGRTRGERGGQQRPGDDGRGPPHRTGPLLPFESHDVRSEEHTSELQSRVDLVCRLLLE